MEQKQRVNCFDAGCNKCSNGLWVGESFLGFNLYYCNVSKRRHRKIKAQKCYDFRCNDDLGWNYCKRCQQKQGK